MPKVKAAPIAPTEVRWIMLRYFYTRNTNATSIRGKKGSAVKISAVKAELKAQHELSQKDVQSNLTYMLSQGWIGEQEVQKDFTTASGTVIPSSTKFYQITAAGIDRIEGEGEFTMPRFNGIKIEATGQNIITLGDGNKIDAHFGDLGNSLAELRDAIAKSDASEAEKLNLVADIYTIQSQLVKSQPNKSIIAAVWQDVKQAATIKGCSALVDKVGSFIAGFIS